MEDFEIFNREARSRCATFAIGLYLCMNSSRQVQDVDIDEELLITYSMRAKPMITDYINRRKLPLRVDIYKGSIDCPAECLRDVDAVIGIEIIEHLYPDVLENLPYNIFGFIHPKLVILSTPNSEYNVLFNLNLPNGFRHYDHKFEWTREQFRDWSYNICTRFPNYEVAFLGAGEPPSTNREVGHVSQIAIFIRNDLRNLDLIDIKREADNFCGTGEYKLLYSIDYPVVENEPCAEKLLNAVKYHIFRHLNMKDRYYCEETDRYEIPIENIFEFVHPQTSTVEELKNYLVENKYQVDNNMILIDRNDHSEEEDVESTDSSDIKDSRVENLAIIDSDECWD